MGSRLSAGARLRPSRLWSEPDPTFLVAFMVAGDCPIMGLGSFGTLAFLGQKRVRCMGPPIPRVRPPFNELWQSSLQGQGVVRVKGRLAGGLRLQQREISRIAGPGFAPPGVAPPARRVMSTYSVVKDPRRGNGRLETNRGRRSIYGSVAASGIVGWNESP